MSDREDDEPVDVSEGPDGETETETETDSETETETDSETETETETETGMGTGTGTGTGFDAEAVLAEESLGEPRRIDGRVRYQWLVGTTVAAVVSALVVTGIFQVTAGRVGVDPTGTLPLGISETTVLVAVLAFVAFEGLAGLRAVLLYRSWRYEIRADSLYLTRGVLTRVQTVAPYVRVQHIDTRRSPFERLLGLSSLVVYTAGSRGADVTVPGLTDERAAELQRRLKRLAIASEEADAV